MGGESKIIHIPIPKISDLAYYIGLIDPNEKRDQSAPTEFQWQILKTRFFIWKNQDVLAAPIPKRTSQIHIIISKDMAHTLPEKLKEEKLIPDGPYSLDEYVYQECISYTLTFKMSPQWHRILNYFLYSNEFLASEDPVEGVKFDLSINGNEGKLRMAVSMHRVKLPLLNLDSMGVNVESLKTNGFARVNATVYILPQLKKGTAVYISVKIPDGCPFASYSQLRRHWKNTHGYHLPHDEEGMLYVGVNFGYNTTPYSYPIVCTRSGKLHQLKSKYADLSLFKFGENIMRKMPSICGKAVDIVVQDDGSIFPLAEFNPERDNETKKKNGKSSGTKSSKSVPTATQSAASAGVAEEIEVDDTMTVPFSLDSNNPTQEIFKPIIEPPNLSIITPVKNSAFVSTTSTPLPSSSVLRSGPSFVPVLSPITKEPTVVQSVPILKPLQEINPLKRPLPVSMEAAGLVLINDEPALKKPAPVVNKNLHPGNLVSQIPLLRNENPSSEIECLARSKSLHSLTIPVLKTFCQQNSIQVSYKDKKDAIVQKVYQYFGV